MLTVMPFEGHRLDQRFLELSNALFVFIPHVQIFEAFDEALSLSRGLGSLSIHLSAI